MLPFSLPPLVLASGWAMPAALLAGPCLPAATAWSALGLCAALASRRRIWRAGLAALPALLAAAPARPAPPIEVRPGPVHVAGVVLDVVRAPVTGHSYVRLGPRGSAHTSALSIGFDRLVDVLPGDRIEVLARGGQGAAPGDRPRLRAVPATLVRTPGPTSVPRVLAALRHALQDELLRLLPGERGAMLSTLVLGRATLPDRALTEAHRATGLSHLLAVSGAHAAMLAFLLGLGGRGRHLGARRGRLVVGLVLLLLYGGIAGGEPPVLRAVVAFGLAACAARLGRRTDVAAALAAPALLTCVVEPDALSGPSFLLSYAAVFGLSLAWRAGPGGARGWLEATLRASWWATLLTAPLTLWFFHQLAPWTILLTPVCAPLVAALLLGGLSVALLGLASPAVGELLAVPLGGLADLYAGIVVAADGLPGTPVRAVVDPPALAVLLTAAIAVGLMLWRPGRTTLQVAVLLVVATWFVPLAPEPRPAFRLFAVGHGQAAQLVTTAGDRVVVDCGSLQGGARAARCVETSSRLRSVDLLVLTHADQDHHNGTAELLRRLRVRAAVVPAGLEHSDVHRALLAHGASVHVLAPGERTAPLPGLAVFAPDLPAGSGDNDLSLWVRAEVGARTVLLTGDAQELGTAAALAAGFAAPCDVLVLPHHGRPNANAAHLLARTRPRACLVSAEVADGESALGPLARRFGADLWATGVHGSITVHAEPPSITCELGARPLR